MSFKHIKHISNASSELLQTPVIPDDPEEEGNAINLETEDDESPNPLARTSSTAEILTPEENDKGSV